VFGLAACSGEPEELEPAGAGSSEGQPSNSDEQTSSTPFGGTYTYDDGTTLTISQPRSFEPSKRAQAGGEPEFVRFKVTLQNDSDSAIEPANINVTVESDSNQAGEVRDAKNGLNGPPGRRIPPGSESTWALGFGVFAIDDISVHVQTAPDSSPVAFGAAT
jgi:hypothetical protein